MILFEEQIDVTLYHGDCLIEGSKIPDNSIDAIIADLPYGTTACKWDVIIPFRPLWELYKRVIKRRGAIVLFGNQPFTSLLITSNLEWFKYCWVWIKNTVTSVMNAKHQPLRNIEDVAVFCDSVTTYNPQGVWAVRKSLIDSGESENYGGKSHKPYTQAATNYPRQVLKFSTENGLHPTQKPILLLEYLIKTYTNEGDTVLDNVMGSGTTGVACMNLDRHFVGIEKEPEYFELASRRIEKARRQPRQLSF